MTRIMYGCCVGSWDKFERYVRNDKRELVTRHGANTIASAYNSILDEVCGSPRPLPDALILLHDDLEIIDEDAEFKFTRALFTNPTVALVGVAGARRSAPTIAWWDCDPVGHQLIDTGLIDFGTRAGEVTALEGSIIVMSRWAVANLRFDERYAGFHGYDCDIVMQAREAGKTALVTDVDTHHHTNIGFKTDESAQSWRDADARFRDKWFW